MIEFSKYKAEWIASLAVMAILAVSIIFEFSQPINRDVSTFIYCAQEYLYHGKIPYRDIVDMNPPLSTWLFMPPVFLAHALKWASASMIMACLVEIYALLIGGFLLNLFVAKCAFPDLSKAQLGVFAVFFAFIVFLGSSSTFGQRDHLILVFVLPAILLACGAATKNSGTLPGSARLAAGLLAWAAIAMKPHYALALLLPELVVLARQRRIAAVFRPETLTVLILGVIYALIILTCYPGIFQAGSMALHAYGAFSVMSIKSELRTFAPFVGVLLLRVMFRFFGKPSSFDALLAGILGAYLAYLAQGIGFFYQTIPFEGLSGAWILLALPPLWPLYKSNRAMPETGKRFLKKLKIRYGLVSIGLLAVCFLAFELSMPHTMLRVGELVLGLSGSDGPTPEAEMNDKTLIVFHRYAGRGPVMLLSAAMQGFPSLLYADLEVSGRWGFLWPLPAELKLPPEQRGLVAKNVAEDMARDKPTLVLVDAAELHAYLPYKFDFVEYLDQWPEFRQQWRHYHRIKVDSDINAGTYALYRRDR